MDKLIAYDKEVFLWLNGLGTTYWDPFWLAVTDKWTSIPVYLLLLILIYRKFGIKATIGILVTVAILITATDQLSNLFKYSVLRLRPCYDETVFELMRLVKSSCGGKYGYFSAHAANAFGIITFFSLLLRKSYKWVPHFLLFWALLVAYSRVYLGVHFPLDVISGICAGMILGWFFYYLFKHFIRPRLEKPVKS